MNVDLLVLARYMQIFSEDFCSRHAKHTINIHHSFLPAFEGKKSGHLCSAWVGMFWAATFHTFWLQQELRSKKAVSWAGLIVPLIMQCTLDGC